MGRMGKREHDARIKVEIEPRSSRDRAEIEPRSSREAASALRTSRRALPPLAVTTFLIWQVEIAERLQDLKRLDALESSLESTDYGV